MLEGHKGILAGRALLPPLCTNIKCGNSLIDHRIIEDSGVDYEMTGTDLDRVNPFDWESKTEGFGEILENGGFAGDVSTVAGVQIPTSLFEQLPVSF